MLYLTSASSLFVVSVYSSIKFVNDIPLSAMILLALVYINCTSYIVDGCTAAANVHTYSLELIRSWKVSARRSRIVRRQLMACAPLKIKVGTNYIDKLTPLVIMDFTISQTVSVLLMD
jgi:hypothetical protein